jgi:tryptophanyl-tRNA synthetase
MRYDRDEKPGLANLLEILAAATGRTPEGVAGEYARYGDLKNDVAAVLVELLRPIRERRTALEGDRAYVDDVLAQGAAHAHEVAAAVYARAADAIGLLPGRAD